MLRIFADFNSFDPKGIGRIFIGKIDNTIKANKLSPGLSPDQLHPEDKVILYTPNDLEVEAILEVDHESNGDFWYGLPDWSTRRDLD